MNKLTKVLLGKVLASASFLALMVPGMANAADHVLTVVGQTVTQNAVIGHTGTVNTPLVVRLNTNANQTVDVTLGQSQSLTTRVIGVKMCAKGTGGNLEWLDQGQTVIGVTGFLTSGNSSTVPNNGYKLTLGISVTSDTYGASTGSCSPQGAKSYVATTSAKLEKDQGSNMNTVFDSTYGFWNAANTVPEPGTLALMLMGLLGLGWLSRKRLPGKAV